MRVRDFLLILTVMVLSAVAYEPVAGAQSSERPAVERCREFCGRVYSENGEEYEECAVACHEADACHRSCKEKLGDDRPKVQRCLRNCMRRGAEPPDQPAEKPVPL
jgi:hypothetical protein